MSRHCQVTGAVPGFGHNVPWSKKKTQRRFNVNVQTKRYWVPSLGRTVKLTVSARGIKVIDARGIDAVVADLLAQGKKL
ncbi:50S ribosomal protein L28 [Arachnia propionica]|uniref:Large ribosomal subunit protein bL28 n=1 Tax=Arachnia propionica TaxID=1750 RepID=A0A3P1WPB3_9ACTN|nr:50S ribosomal protein L28 [Arachnia propionica]RRD48085.1 50S ribosomal protein L28 [Arachnia propionica]